EVLRLTPSSINIQPWHFFIADDAAAKQRIAKALVGTYAYNAPKVLDSSHTILFCTKADIDELHLKNLLKRDDLNGRFKDEHAQESRRAPRTSYLDSPGYCRGGLMRWPAKPTFIALGQSLLAAGSDCMYASRMGGLGEYILSD